MSTEFDPAWIAELFCISTKSLKELSMNVESMIVSGLAVGILAAPQISNAATATATGTISEIYVFQGNRVAVSLNGHDKDSLNNSNTPAGGGNNDCIATNSGNWVIELTTDNSENPPVKVEFQTGTAQYALLLSAQAQGKTVFVRGTNYCSGGRATVNYIRLND